MNYCYVIFFVACMLAVLSKKNYSKYKDKGVIRRLFYGMADKVYEWLYKKGFMSGARSLLRSTNVAADEKLDALCRNIFVRVLAVCIFFLYATAGLVCLLETTEAEDRTDALEILRADYDGEATELEVLLTNGRDAKSCTLLVEPVKYTREQFLEKAKKIFDETEKQILGENKSADHVTEDLQLVQYDKSGVFEFQWQSENPACISSSGKLMEDYTGDTRVKLVAKLFYEDFVAEHEYWFEVSYDKEKAEADRLEAAKLYLEDYLKEHKNDASVRLPDKVEGVSVRVRSEEKTDYNMLFVVALLVCLVLVRLRYNGLKESKEKRDDMLMIIYPSFVNKLWLYLGTGMTIRAGLERYVAESHEKNILTEEIGYALNLIDSGVEEAVCYEELGRNLALKEYIKLMDIISRNLRFGTSDIRRVMEDEIHIATQLREENARQKGEKASTKLLVPMILMLFVTMLVVIYPVMKSF